MPSKTAAAARPKPPARDPERTRNAILTAAKSEFAARGLAGARVDRIAERAGANKRMIYHYFGGKDGLYLAVLEDAYLDMRSAEARLPLRSLEPEDALKRLVAFNWYYCVDHPEFMALLNNENLHRAAHLRRSERVREMHSPLLDLIGDILERGVAAGKFRRGVDAMQLYISIAALGYFYLSNRHTLSTIFARDLMTAEAQQARLSHVTETILALVRR